VKALYAACERGRSESTGEVVAALVMAPHSNLSVGRGGGDACHTSTLLDAVWLCGLDDGQHRDKPQLAFDEGEHRRTAALLRQAESGGSSATVLRGTAGNPVVPRGILEGLKMRLRRACESAEDAPGDWSNLAHLHLARKEYSQAIKLYKQCNGKFYNDADISMLHYIASALFEWSQDLQSIGNLKMATQKMLECRQHCETSAGLDPSNPFQWFNVAVTKLAAASITMSQKAPSAAHVRQTITELDHVNRLFAVLENTGAEPGGDSQDAMANAQTAAGADSFNDRARKKARTI
jgi:tetratricopeptide (TPR) repeat protein